MPTSENTYALTSLERVKQHIELMHTTKYDTELVEIINAVSSSFESYCQRNFLSRTYTHDGTTRPRIETPKRPSNMLFLPNPPITSVTNLQLTPTDTALTEGWDEDFVVHNDSGVIELTQRTTFRIWPWLGGTKSIEVTYVGGYLRASDPGPPTADQLDMWGWEERAKEVQLEAVRASAWVYTQKKREREGVTSMSSEGVTVQYLVNEFLPSTRGVLDRFVYAAPVVV